MKYTSTLISVANMEISKRFYQDVMGMKVTADFGDNVTLDDSVVLQTLDTWKSFIKAETVILPNNAGELYFVEDNIEAFCDHLNAFEISYVHKLFEHPWGQRVVRFYDPDKHIIEVGERIEAVVLRFIEQGLSAKETAIRMDIPISFVHSCLDDR